MAAAANGKLQVVRFLVGQGARVNALDAVSACCPYACVGVCVHPLSLPLHPRSLSPNPRPQLGRSALYSAAFNGHLATVSYLLDEAGCDPLSITEVAADAPLPRLVRPPHAPPSRRRRSSSLCAP
jgi:ankyrin repeat protein